VTCEIDYNNFLEEAFELPHFYNRDIGWNIDLHYCDYREKYSDTRFLRSRRRAIKFHENNLSTFTKQDIVNTDFSLSIELEEKFYIWLINKHNWNSDKTLQFKNIKTWLNHGWSLQYFIIAKSQHINPHLRKFTMFEISILETFEIEIIKVHTNLKISEQEQYDWIIYPALEDNDI